MKFLPFTPDRALVNHDKRLKNLERAAGQPNRPTTYEISPASQYGAVATTTLGDTPAWDTWVGGQVTALIVRLATAGTSNTVATFYVNGSSIGTVTLASGDTRIQTTVNVRVKNTDGIQVVITTAGTGAKGLSAFLRMKG